MNSIEMIDSLIDQALGLETSRRYPPKIDSDALSKFRSRSTMILTNLLGNDSPYISRLISIQFFNKYLTPTNIEKDVYEKAVNDTWDRGVVEVINLLSVIKEELVLFRSNKQEKAINDKTSFTNKIFIVHGHNDKMKLFVARSIDKLGLVPIILHEQPNMGRTIIEKFQEHSDVGYAIILLSPDDLGYPKNKSASEAKPRARQNVILELGYFLGKLGRQRVMALYLPDENFEMPSDFSGVLYVAFDDAGKWQFDLVRELKACEYDVDANKLV